MIILLLNDIISHFAHNIILIRIELSNIIILFLNHIIVYSYYDIMMIRIVLYHIMSIYTQCIPLYVDTYNTCIHMYYIVLFCIPLLICCLKHIERGTQKRPYNT